MGVGVCRSWSAGRGAPFEPVEQLMFRMGGEGGRAYVWEHLESGQEFRLHPKVNRTYLRLLKF